jgi:ADP-dependent phosphofructokinase/glucokinase
MEGSVLHKYLMAQKSEKKKTSREIESSKQKWAVIFIFNYPNNSNFNNKSVEIEI